MPIRVFISHSSADKDIAKALTKLIRSAFTFSPAEIRCTSVDGYRLPTGASTDHQLRLESIEAESFIAILTPKSLESTYVLFELGARWGTKRPLFPLLAGGATPNDLREPLKALTARMSNSRNEMFQFLTDLGNILHITGNKPETYGAEMEEFLCLVADDEVCQSSSDIPTFGKSESSVPTPSLQRSLCQTARAICTRIREAPPLQEARIAADFKGYFVDWETTFEGASLKDERSGVLRLSLCPWEPNGYDIGISCQVNLAEHPELKELPKKAPIWVRGRIVRAESHAIELVDTAIKVMDSEERRGTRIAWLVPTVKAQLDHSIASTVKDITIEDSIRAQVRMNRPEGLSMLDGKRIVPELKDGSLDYKLLVLYAAKQLIEGSAGLSNKDTQDRLLSIQYQIDKLKNFG